MTRPHDRSTPASATARAAARLGLMAMALAAVAALVSPAPDAEAATRPTYGELAADYARANLVGKPYRWGFRGEDGFDCSGSVYLAWKHSSPGRVSNAWSARQYAEEGARVWVGTGTLSAASLREGDLLFWSTNGRTSGIYHVALYVGDGQILQTGDGSRSWLASMNFNRSGRMPYAIRPHGASEAAPSAHHDAVDTPDAYRHGDFNGDGRMDTLWFTGTTATKARHTGWQIAYSTTSTAARFTKALHHPATPVDDTIVIADVNGDAHDDVLWLTGHTNTRLEWTGWQVAYGTPTGVRGLTQVSTSGARPALESLDLPLPGTARVPHLDVAPTHQFHHHIAWLAERGITTGWSDGTFRPQQAVSREAFAAYLYRLSGSPAVRLPARSPFRDVGRDAKFYREIVWLAQQGITTGYADGTFRPSQEIDRNAMAAFLYRFEGEPPFTAPRTSPFRDLTTSSPFYREVTWLERSGITTGYADGTFRPFGSVTREATAAFLYRLTR